MSDILSLDATAQLSALSSGRIGAAELLEETRRRWESANGALGAVVVADWQRAQERARAIDEHRRRGDHLGPLAGLPMTIKDTLDVEGMPASAGLDVFRHGHRPDAGAVARARAAGAVIWGKTNVPVMAGDWQSYNSLYGTTNNPWDRARTSGGSSGGAAAALAAGITALEIGSDIGGSLRVPASFCGVYAHKPTWGLVSQLGHVPPKPGTHGERDVNVVGPMARSARDLRLLLSQLESGPLAAKAPPAELKGLKIGLWLDEPAFVLSPDVRHVMESFAAELRAQGAIVVPMPSPVDARALLETYRVLLMGALAEDAPPARLRSMRRLRPVARIAAALGAGQGSWAAAALAYTASHADWLAANETRARMGAQMRRIFTQIDIVMAPCAPVAAFPHDHSPFRARTLTLCDGRKAPYTAMTHWIALASACGLPATAIPAGRTPEGLPVGAQLIGPRGGDSRALAAAEAIEARLGGFDPAELEKRGPGAYSSGMSEDEVFIGGVTRAWLRARSQTERHNIWKRARALHSAEGNHLARAIELLGLPYAEPEPLEESDPLMTRMRALMAAPEARAAAIEATLDGLPAIAGIDVMLHEAIGEEYRRNEAAAPTAQMLTAQLMQGLGYVEAGQKALPARCVARSGVFWKRS